MKSGVFSIYLQPPNPSTSKNDGDPRRSTAIGKEWKRPDNSNGRQSKDGPVASRQVLYERRPHALCGVQAGVKVGFERNL